jgi:TPR repeat protein
VWIAEYYSSGQFVRQDYVEATKWFLKAAEQGIPCAQLQLGQMYRDGQGGSKDDIQAHKWLNLAAADQSGLDYGHGYCVETAVKERAALAVAMTTAQIAEAQRLAREWKPRISPDPIPKRHPGLFGR